MENPDLWNDAGNAQKILRQRKQIIDSIDNFTRIQAGLANVDELIELSAGDELMLTETANELATLEQQINQLHIDTLLSGKYDNYDAILTLHAGAGGTESQDWVQMLYRMYTRYCERRDYKISVLDILDGEEAGIKSVTFLVEGTHAYGYLKAEKGVHRLVRISPFDSNKRRHTSFVSLEVMPKIDNDIDIVIDEKDLKIDTYRSSGAGGQHVNKTESAIRITHIPTGLVAACQNERSQVQNREQALAMLKSKLVELKERQQMDEAMAIKGNIKKIEWGSQIRSYVFCPYTMVKDHRTGYEVGSISDVMDGNLHDFIEQFLINAL